MRLPRRVPRKCTQIRISTLQPNHKLLSFYSQPDPGWEKRASLANCCEDPANIAPFSPKFCTIRWRSSDLAEIFILASSSRNSHSSSSSDPLCNIALADAYQPLLNSGRKNLAIWEVKCLKSWGRSLDRGRCDFSCSAWMLRAKQVRRPPTLTSRTEPQLIISHSYPLQAEAQFRCHYDSYCRLQCRDRDVQKCQIQCLGCGWARQDSTFVEALLLRLV